MRTRARTAAGWLAAALLLAGCSREPDQPPFPSLNPVKGVVRKGGKPVTGGAVRFSPDPDTDEFMITGPVADDGTFMLSTIRRTDRAGERLPGAAAGSYRVTFTPKSVDQTAERNLDPVTLPQPVVVSAGENNLTLDLPAK